MKATDGGWHCKGVETTACANSRQHVWVIVKVPPLTRSHGFKHEVETLGQSCTEDDNRCAGGGGTVVGLGALSLKGRGWWRGRGTPHDHKRQTCGIKGYVTIQHRLTCFVQQRRKRCARTKQSILLFCFCYPSVPDECMTKALMRLPIGLFTSAVSISTRATAKKLDASRTENRAIGYESSAAMSICFAVARTVHGTEWGIGKCGK